MFFVPSAILAFIPNPIISQNEAWFMSNTEKVHMLWKKLNEVIDRVNTYEELFNELKNILTDFDETVREAVEEYIRQMYENGELKDLVAEIIDEIAREYAETLLTQASKTSTLDFTRLFRFMYLVGENNLYDTNSSKWTYPQGFVHFTRNGVHMCASAFKCSNHNDLVRYGNDARIVLYNMDTHSEVASINLTVGHANSLAYDDVNDMLYIAWNFTNPYNTSAEQLVRSISRISINNILNGSTSSFVTRTPNSAEFDTLSTVAFYNGKLYVGHRNKYCEFDFNNNLLGNTIQLINDDELKKVTHIQDMTINNKYVALLSYLPSRVYLYDKVSNKLVWTYDIPSKLNNGMYRTIEPEGITLEDNGNLYLSSGGHTARKDFNVYDIFQVFKQNIYRNAIAPRNVEAADRIGRAVTVYFNHDFTGDSSNPNGESDNPFMYPQEALNFIEDFDGIGRANLVVQSRLAGVPWYICCKKPLFIYPSPIESQRSGNIGIGAFVIEGCNNLTIRGSFKDGATKRYMEFYGMGAAMEHADTTDNYFDLQKNIIVCKHSTVFFSDLRFTIDTGSQTIGPRGDSRDYIQCALQGRYCMASYGGDNAMTETEFEDTYPDTDFMIFKDSLVNARGKATNNANIIDPSSINYGGGN